jgi:hypothetical protein
MDERYGEGYRLFRGYEEEVPQYPSLGEDIDNPFVRGLVAVGTTLLGILIAIGCLGGS